VLSAQLVDVCEELVWLEAHVHGIFSVRVVARLSMLHARPGLEHIQLRNADHLSGLACVGKRESARRAQ
jgi:hypothetical protein